MGILENIIEKGRQIAQGIKRTIEKIKNTVKFFMTTVRNYCGDSNTSSSNCSFTSCVIKNR